MKTGIRTALFVLIATTVAAAAPSLEASLSAASIDLVGRRLFIAPSADIVRSKDSTRAYLAKLVAHVERAFPEWGVQWSVSFSSEAQFATYKDDPRISESVADGSWAKSYLAEYNHSSKRLTTTPLTPSTITSYEVK